MANAEPPERSKRWYVEVNSKVYGPYNQSAIAQMVGRGQILSDDPVNQEGASGWIEGRKDPVLAELFRRHSKRPLSGEAEPPIRRKRRGLAWMLAAALTVVALFWIAWPYYALLSLFQALREGDVPTLETRIDWNALRQALRGDLNARLLQNLRKSGPNDGTATGFAALLGPAVINQMIDGYVTPQAIATLGRPEKPTPDASDHTHNFDKSVSLARQVHWNQINYAFFSGGPFTFRVDVLPPNDPPLRAPVRLEFDWNGDWRLTRIVLPDDIFKGKDGPFARPTAGPRAQQERPKVALTDTKTEEPPPVEVSLRSKHFKPADYKANDFEAAIIVGLSIANKSGKDIRAFDGTLTFTDLLDNEIYSSKLAINELIASESTINWSGRVKYNQFEDSQNALKNEDMANLKTRFVVRKVLYADGTTKEYQ